MCIATEIFIRDGIASVADVLASCELLWDNAFVSTRCKRKGLLYWRKIAREVALLLSVINHRHVALRQTYGCLLAAWPRFRFCPARGMSRMLELASLVLKLYV